MAFWKRNNPPPPRAPEPEPVVEQTAAELLAESVRLLKAGLKLEAEEEMAPVEQSLQDSESRLAAAQHTADSMGLWQALAYSIQALQHHHSWIKLDEKYKTPATGVTITAGDRRSVDGTDHIGLLLTVEGRSYVLKWTRSNFQGDIYGNASFETQEQQALFSIDYHVTDRHDLERVHPGAVTKISLGEWVHDLVRLSERLRAAHDLQMTSMRAEFAADKAKDI
ncbi:MAG TPA: hypothetical protein VIL88_02530 [Devosia sp.]|uniref:hypothetical protein n=1 Tax=Devosia sp. TaxID=1871048 RepID=UPI002F94EDEC